MDSVHDTTHEPEIVGPVDLCDGRGRLNPQAVGWSRRPLHRCNLRGFPFRKKRWNYWAFTSDRYLVSATVADVDYLGLAFVYFLDFDTRRYLEQTVATLLARGVRLPPTTVEDVIFEHPRLKVALISEGSGTRVRVESPSFGGLPLTADLLAERPEGHETLNVVIPWSRTRFQFTSKQVALPASGIIAIGDERFTMAAGNSFGCLDFGRGVWRYRCLWNWGAGAGASRGRTIGLNLGGTWTDGTGMTENGIWLDGRLTKIGADLAWEYDRRNLMKPWAVRTARSDQVNVRFCPFFERMAKTDLLLMRSEVHQMFGRYEGAVVAEGGERVSVDGLIGWVEHHEARW